MIIFLNKTKVKEAEYDIKRITDREDSPGRGDHGEAGPHGRSHGASDSQL